METEDNGVHPCNVDLTGECAAPHAGVTPKYPQWGEYL